MYFFHKVNIKLAPIYTRFLATNWFFLSSSYLLWTTCPHTFSCEQDVVCNKFLSDFSKAEAHYEAVCNTRRSFYSSQIRETTNCSWDYSTTKFALKCWHFRVHREHSFIHFSLRESNPLKPSVADCWAVGVIVLCEGLFIHSAFVISCSFSFISYRRWMHHRCCPWQQFIQNNLS